MADGYNFFPDPEEEERKRQEEQASALSALAAAGAHNDREDPVQLDYGIPPGELEALVEEKSAPTPPPEEQHQQLFPTTGQGAIPDPAEEIISRAASGQTPSDEPTEVFFRKNKRYPSPRERRDLYKQMNGGAEPSADLIKSWQDNTDWKMSPEENEAYYQKLVGMHGGEFDQATGDKATAQVAQGGAQAAAPRPGKGPSDAQRSPAANELPTKDGADQEAPKAPGTEDPLTAADPFAALRAAGEAERKEALSNLGDRPGVNGWALLADVVFNQGKGIPNIIEMGDRAGRAFDDDKRKILAQRGAASDPLALMRIQGARDAFQLRKDNAKAKADGARAEAEQMVADREAFMSAFGDRIDKIPGLREKLSKASPSVFRSLATEYRERWKQSPEYQGTHALGQQLDAKGRKVGEIEGTASVLPTATANAEALSGAAAKGAAPHQVATSQAREGYVSPQDVLDNQYKKEAADRAAREEERRIEEGKRKLKADEEAKVTSARKEDEGWKRGFTKDTEFSQQLAHSLNKLDAIEARYNHKNVPGKGYENGSAAGTKVGSFVSGVGEMANSDDPETAQMFADAAEFQTTLRGIANDFLISQSGKTFGVREEELNAIRVGTSLGASEAQTDRAIKTMRDLVKRKISSFASSRPDLAEEVLRSANIDPATWGSESWVGVRRAPGATPMAQQLPPPGSPEAATSALAAAGGNGGGLEEDTTPLTPTEQRDLDSYRQEFGTNPDGSPIDSLPTETAERPVQVPGEPGHTLPNLIGGPDKRGKTLPKAIDAVQNEFVDTTGPRMTPSAAQGGGPKIPVEIRGRDGTWSSANLTEAEIAQLEQKAAAKGNTSFQIRMRGQ